MPPRDQQLPEGTDQIIDGAMATGAGAGASTGSSGSGGFGGTGSGGTTPGGSADFSTGTGTGASGASSGFIGAGSAGGSGDGTGGFASGGGSGGSSGGTGIGGGSGGSDFGSGSGASGGSGGAGSAMAQQARGQVQNVKQQATDKVRAYAVDGKSRASSALDDLSQVVHEAAQSIDERLGPQYGDYARRAAGSVSEFAETIRNKDVDELFEDARQLVRKSPAIAIGTAAAVGFALVRLVKAGIPDQQQGDVEFRPDPALGTDAQFTASGSTGIGGTSTAGTSSVDSQAPYVAPTTGV